MPTEIICSIISLCGCLASIVSSMGLVNWRLSHLEKKVDEHNSWGERFAKQSTDIALISQDVSYIKKAIDKLERSSDT
ncbi:MAG: hypothetical protein Q4F31_09925 [Eubacteriales bacterium]|nr:hypothetical protein [Eubacteriales bacterium]